VFDSILSSESRMNRSWTSTCGSDAVSARIASISSSMAGSACVFSQTWSSWSATLGRTRIASTTLGSAVTTPTAPRTGAVMALMTFIACPPKVVG